MNIPSIRLNSGYAIPALAFGTYKIADSDEAYRSVKEALSLGYRHIDTAAFYQNEAAVGRAIKDFIADGNCKREDIFVTSKVWKTEAGYDKTMAAHEKTMKEIGLDYIDLYLVHWPASFAFDSDWENTNRSSWKAMMEICKNQTSKSIGVSNFLTHHLNALMDSEILPAVDQIEINPGFLQKETVDFCQKNGIVVEAWSPLGRGKSLDNKVLNDLADQYHKSIAQIILRWELQHDIVPLPKTVNSSRMVENADIFDFTLSAADMAKIDEIPPYGNSGHSPDQAD